MKFLWTAMFLGLLAILGTVGFLFAEKQKHSRFWEEVAEFQKQTATYDDSKAYHPNESITAEWTFDPIEWDTDVVMTATFLFENTDTDKVYVTGEVRVLPFFNELQYQVSTPITWNPTGLRKLSTSYTIPAQVESGNYVIRICQRFDHDANQTDWSCYSGPTFEVRTTPRGS